MKNLKIINLVGKFVGFLLPSDCFDLSQMLEMLEKTFKIIKSSC